MAKTQKSPEQVLADAIAEAKTAVTAATTSEPKSEIAKAADVQAPASSKPVINITHSTKRMQSALGGIDDTVHASVTKQVPGPHGLVITEYIRKKA